MTLARYETLIKILFCYEAVSQKTVSQTSTFFQPIAYDTVINFEGIEKNVLSSLCISIFLLYEQSITYLSSTYEEWALYSKHRSRLLESSK